jgi:hypothetical protein
LRKPNTANSNWYKSLYKHEDNRATSRRNLINPASTQLRPVLPMTSSPFPGVLSARREFISRSIEEIRADLDMRRSLHEEVLSGLGDDLQEARLQRAYLDNWSAGYSPPVESRKSALDGLIGGMRQQIIEEDLSYWKDSTALHKELREALSAEALAATAEDIPPPALSPPPPHPEGVPARRPRRSPQEEGVLP